MRLKEFSIWSPHMQMLAVVAIFQLIYWADSFRNPMITAPIMFFLLLFVAWKQVRKQEEDTNTIIEHWAIRLTGITTLWFLKILISDTPYQGFIIYPNQGAVFAIIVALIILMAGKMIFRPPKTKIALLMLLVGAVLLRGNGLEVSEINPVIRDMLPLIISGLETFTNGENPYTIYAMQVDSEIPLTYPPLLWMSHLPAYLLGLDIRWTNIAADIIVACSLAFAAMKFSPKKGAIALIGIAAYLYLPDVHWNGIYAEPHIDWAILSLLSFAILSRRNWLVGIAYGLALLTRPFNVVYALLIFIWAIRLFGSRIALRTLTISGIIAGIGYLPFVLADPDAFFFGTVQWLVECGPANPRPFFTMLGLAGPILQYDHANWLLPIQLFFLLSTHLLALWKLRSTRSLLILMLFTYASFIALNSLIWMSFWISVGILAIAVVLVEPEDPVFAPKPWRLEKQMILELAATISVILMATTILGKLYLFSSHKGQEDVQSLLINEAEPGDLILDFSGYRLAFVRTPPILAEEELPEEVVLSTKGPFNVTLQSQIITSSRRITPGEHTRVWIVERHHLFEKYMPLFLDQNHNEDGFYTIVQDSYIGRYHVMLLERKAEEMITTLSENLSSVEAELVLDNETRRGLWQNDQIAFENTESWGFLHNEQCLINNRRRPLIWAHPIQDAQTQITTSIPDQARWMTLYGGFVDESVFWQFSSIQMTVFFDNILAEQWVFPNLIGLNGMTISIPNNSTLITLKIEGIESVGMRHFCMDATFWN